MSSEKKPTPQSDTLIVPEEIFVLWLAAFRDFEPTDADFIMTEQNYEQLREKFKGQHNEPDVKELLEANKKMLDIKKSMRDIRKEALKAEDKKLIKFMNDNNATVAIRRVAGGNTGALKYTFTLQGNDLSCIQEAL